MLHHPVSLTDVCACGHTSHEHSEGHGHCHHAACGCTHLRDPEVAARRVELDLTSLPADLAAAIHAALPEDDPNRAQWVRNDGTDTYTATTHHPLPDGRTLIAHTVRDLADLHGDDWRHVAGLTPSDWHDYTLRERGL